LGTFGVLGKIGVGNCGFAYFVFARRVWLQVPDPECLYEGVRGFAVGLGLGFWGRVVIGPKFLLVLEFFGVG
jgi:hypothetical protein